MKVRTAIIAAAVIPMLITGCHPDWWLGGDDGSENGGTSVAFETLARGEYGGITQQGERVISSETEWKSLWQDVHSTMIPVPQRPEVDFTRYTVLAVFQGEQRNGGHSIRITSISDKGNALAVDVRSTVPGAGCIITDALTQPYHIVMVDKVSAQASFAYTTQTTCSGD